MSNSGIDGGVPHLFAAKITQVQRLLDESGIPHRLLGSVATYAHIQHATNWRLNFERSRWLPRHQRIPDLDYLVPISHLEAAERLRQGLLRNREYPVNLELLSAITHFDWRPGDEYSYITHRNLRVPFQSSLFDLAIVELDGASVHTIPPRSLLHIYVTMGATLRAKDREPVRALARLSYDGQACQPEYWPFHQFIRQCQKQYPGYVMSRVAAEWLRNNMPTAPFYWLTNAGKRLQPILFRGKSEP